MKNKKLQLKVNEKIGKLVDELDKETVDKASTLNEIDVLSRSAERLDDDRKVTDVISIDTLIKSGVSIAGLLMILRYEQTDIITTKGLDFVKRLLP